MVNQVIVSAENYIFYQNSQVIKKQFPQANIYSPADNEISTFRAEAISLRGHNPPLPDGKADLETI